MLYPLEVHQEKLVPLSIMMGAAAPRGSLEFLQEVAVTCHGMQDIANLLRQLQ